MQWSARLYHYKSNLDACIITSYLLFLNNLEFIEERYHLVGLSNIENDLNHFPSGFLLTNPIMYMSQHAHTHKQHPVTYTNTQS